MNRSFVSVLVFLLLGCAVRVPAQSRLFGVGGLVLDDGSGHTITLLTPPGLSGNYTYSLPASPGGNIMSGYVQTGSAFGQVLYWNGSYWQPSGTGASGQVLELNISGVPTWTTGSGGGGIAGTGTNGTIPIWTGTSSQGNSHLTDNGTTLSYSGTHINSATDYQIGGSTVLTATNYIGTATNATNIATTGQSGSSPVYPLFVPNFVSGNQAAGMTPQFFYTPSTNTLTATTFAGTATNATNVGTTVVNGLGISYPLLVPNASTGNQSTDVNSGLSYNTTTNTLTTTTFAGTATNATNIATTVYSGSGPVYIPFVPFASTANQPMTVNSGLSYEPTTNTLTATKFAGTATNATNVGTTVVNGLGISYPLLVPNASTGNQSTDVNSGLSFNTTTNTLTATTFAGTATNASNVATTVISGLGVVYPIFVPNASTANQLPGVNGNLAFNTTTNTLTTTTFVGNLSGTATNATNVGTSVISGLGTVYPVFVPNAAAQNQSPGVNSGLSFNTTTNTLTATTFAGTATNASNVATTVISGLGVVYPIFVPNASTANQLPGVNSGLAYNTTTGTISATTFAGAGSLTTLSTSGAVTLNNLSTSGSPTNYLALDGSNHVMLVSGTGSFVEFNTPFGATQTSTTAGNWLFNLTSSPASGPSYGGSIISSGTGSGSVTGLTIASSSSAGGPVVGLSVGASGGSTNTAIDVTSGNVIVNGNISTSGGGTITASTGSSGLVLGSGANATTLSSTAHVARAISFPDNSGTLALTTDITGFVNFNTAFGATQTSTTAGNWLFDLASSPASGPSWGAHIVSSGADGGSSVTGLTIASSSIGGPVVGLSVGASGGTTNTAIDVTSGNVIVNGNISTSGGGTITASTGSSGLVLGSGANATTLSSTAHVARAISFPDNSGTLALTTDITGFVNFNTAFGETQTSTTAGNWLFNLTSSPASGPSYGGSIISSGTGSGSVTGLTIASSSSAGGPVVGLSVGASGGSTNTAIDVTSGNVIVNGNIVTSGGGTITATTFTGNLSGTATSATNVVTTVENNVGTVYPIFAPGLVDGNQLPGVNSGLSFNTTTNTLTATTFAGTATNASNVATTVISGLGVVYPIFVPNASTANQLPGVNSGLAYNTTTGTISATTFAGAGSLTTLSTSGAVTLNNLSTSGTPTNYLALDGSNHVMLVSGAGGITGTGTAGTIPIWTTGTSQGDSHLTDDGTTLSYSGQHINSSVDYRISNSTVLIANSDQGNLFLGDMAGGTSMNTAEKNTFLGESAGGDNSSGSYNTFAGYRSGYSNTGSQNTFLGYGIATSNGGSNNTITGYEAGSLNTSGSGNTFMGYFSGATNQSGDSITTIGFRANASDGLTDATAIGANAVVTTSNTIQLGDSHDTLVNSNGNFNTAGVYEIGGSTVVATAISNSNLFLGDNAGGSSILTSDNNTFVGESAGGANTNGSDNTFSGYNSGQNNTGDYNTFSGESAGQGNTGNHNTFSGYGTATENSGDNNTFSGYEAGESNGSGHDNTFVGYGSGASNGSGNYITALGDYADANDNLTDATAIGANAHVTTSHTVQLGDGSVDSVISHGSFNTTGGGFHTNGVTRIDASGNGTFASINTDQINNLQPGDNMTIEGGMPFSPNDGYQHLYIKHFNVAIYDGNLGVGSGRFSVGAGDFKVLNDGTTTIQEQTSGNDALTITGDGGNDITGTSDYWQVDGYGNATLSTLTTTTNVSVGQNLIQQSEGAVDVSAGPTTLDGLASIYDLSVAAASTTVSPPATTTTQVIYVHNATGNAQTIAGATVADGKTATIVYFPTSGWIVTGVY